MNIRILPCLALLAALSPLLPTRAGETLDQANLNAGYYLLYHFSDDESKVGLLLALKTVPPEITVYANQVAQLATGTKTALEQFKQKDSAIQFNRNPLPQIEAETREGIKSDKTHQLLFGASGKEFSVVFLAALIEGCNYGLNLTNALANHEASPGRAKRLAGLSEKWLALRNEGDRLLTHY